MSGEIESRRLTNSELQAQIDRIIQLNMDPNWSEKEKQGYLAAIGILSANAARRTFSNRSLYLLKREKVFEYIEKLNGQLKKDELTLKEEEIERRFEEEQLEEKRRNDEERRKEGEKREQDREERKKRRSEAIKKFFKPITDFFKRLKEGIIKKLTSSKGALTLESGEPEEIKRPSDREKLIKELRENLDIEPDDGSIQESDKEEKIVITDKKPKEKDER